VVATAATGCGGDESAGGSELTTSSLSKAEYIEKADAICKETEDRLLADYETYIREKQGQIQSNLSEAEYAEFARVVVVPNLEREIEEIRALGTPEGDEAQLEEFIRTVEAGLGRAEEEPRLVAAKNGEQVFRSGTQIAKAYGYKVCD
jgi:hypothetical protein